MNKTTKRLFITIEGDVCSGKTTVANIIKEVLKLRNYTIGNSIFTRTKETFRIEKEWRDLR